MLLLQPDAISAVTIQSFPGRPNPPYDPTFVYCPSGGCVTPPTAPVPVAVPAPSASTINGFTTDGKCVKEIDGRLLKGPSFVRLSAAFVPFKVAPKC
jgi:hypothetical protein